MPRKTCARPASARSAAWRSFNEAAARCRGKQAAAGVLPGIHGLPASMRPRPDAAENGPHRRAPHPAPARASMRPRPDAAENPHRDVRRPRAQRSSFNEAAARCRGKLAGRRPLARRATPGFNEAAARCRGKRCAPAAAPGRGEVASMRPRPDAAENPSGCALSREGQRASMRPRPDAAEN